MPSKTPGLSPDLSRLIDKMEVVRMRNNVLWMDVVRLVNAVAPVEAQRIFRKIEKGDREIVRLAKSSARLASQRSRRRRSRRSSAR